MALTMRLAENRPSTTMVVVLRTDTFGCVSNRRPARTEGRLVHAWASDSPHSSYWWSVSSRFSPSRQVPAWRKQPARARARLAPSTAAATADTGSNACADRRADRRGDGGQVLRCRDRHGRRDHDDAAGYRPGAGPLDQLPADRNAGSRSRGGRHRYRPAAAIIPHVTRITHYTTTRRVMTRRFVV